jgi:hypothetical protein
MSVEFRDLPSEARDELFQLNKERLEHMAFKAIKKGMNPREFIAVAIDADDPYWNDLIETVMPGGDFQAIRDLGQKPVARGTLFTDGIVDYLCYVCPDVAPALTSELPPSTVRAVVLSKGVSVFQITPFPHFKDC